MTFDDVKILESPTGAKLAIRHALAMGVSRGIVQLSHGLTEHSGRYGEVAAFLSARGYHVYAHDHRGHGHTTAPDAPLGRFARRNGEAMVLADAATVRVHAVSAHPGVPVVLLGHSMGGVIAARLTETEPQAYAGVAIWNSQLNPGLAGRAGLFLLKAERFFKGSDVPSQLAPRLVLDEWAKAVPDARNKYDWLTHDKSEVDAYLADPLCGFACSVSLWIDLLQMSVDAGLDQNLARLPKSLPFNLVAGSHDPATAKGAAIEWLKSRLEAQGMTDIHLTIYPQMRHETLKEYGRADAMNMLANWVDQVVEKVRN